jgi:alpha-ribazole phosphatase
MIKSQEIYLIRHTTPSIEKGICYGQSDLDVMPTFEEEWKEIYKILPQLDKIYSSPLLRCKKLAEKLTLENMPIHFDNRLLEMNFGEWEMKKWNEIDNELLNNWMENFTHNLVPAGESYDLVKKRVIDFWEDLLENKEEKIGIVTHFGVIQSVLSILFETPPQKTFRFDLDYGAIIRIKKTGNEHYKIKFLK